MKRLYVNKESIVLFLLFLAGLFGLLAGISIIDSVTPLFDEFALYAVSIGVMIMAIYLNSKVPMFIFEYDDKFILQYEHKRLAILKKDITALRYPVKHQRTLCYRIVVNNSKVVTLFGLWGNLSGAFCEWEREHGLPSYQDEPFNNYKPADCDFSFVPTLSSLFTDKRALLLFAMFPAVVRMLRPPYNIVNVILFFVLAAGVYFVCMYLTSFHVEDGVLRTKNAIARQYNHTIELCSIKWIMVAEANMCVKLKDGRAIVVRYRLSKEQLDDFSNAFGSLGIPCIY